MALNPVSVNNYNGLSFVGGSSNKPIVGVSVSVDRFTTAQAKLVSTTPVVPGSAVKVTNDASSASGAGKELNPNVLKAVPVTTADDLSGFLLTNETDILEIGEKAPYARSGQIVSIALLGSLTELYLPADAGLIGANVATKAVWDVTSGTVKAAGTGVTGNIQIIGPVVDGVKFKYDTTSSSVVYENCKVVKVRL